MPSPTTNPHPPKGVLVCDNPRHTQLVPAVANLGTFADRNENLCGTCLSQRLQQLADTHRLPDRTSPSNSAVVRWLPQFYSDADLRPTVLGAGTYAEEGSDEEAFLEASMPKPPRGLLVRCPTCGYEGPYDLTAVLSQDPETTDYAWGCPHCGGTYDPFLEDPT